MSAILFDRAESRSCQSFPITPFCTQLHVFALNYTILHSITLFYTDLGLIDMFLTNQNAEIVACILLTGKYTTRKIHKNYIRDPSGLFYRISHVSLSMIWLISILSLKLYLNSLVYHRNIFGSSSKVFGNCRALE